MVIFNSYVKLPEGTLGVSPHFWTQPEWHPLPSRSATHRCSRRAEWRPRANLTLCIVSLLQSYYTNGKQPKNINKNCTIAYYSYIQYYIYYIYIYTYIIIYIYDICIYNLFMLYLQYVSCSLEEPPVDAHPSSYVFWIFETWKLWKCWDPFFEC